MQGRGTSVGNLACNKEYWSSCYSLNGDGHHDLVGSVTDAGWRRRCENQSLGPLNPQATLRCNTGVQYKQFVAPGPPAHGGCGAGQAVTWWGVWQVRCSGTDVRIGGWSPYHGDNPPGGECVRRRVASSSRRHSMWRHRKRAILMAFCHKQAGLVLKHADDIDAASPGLLLFLRLFLRLWYVAVTRMTPTKS